MPTFLSVPMASMTDCIHETAKCLETHDSAVVCMLNRWICSLLCELGHLYSPKRSGCVCELTSWAVVAVERVVSSIRTSGVYGGFDGQPGHISCTRRITVPRNCCSAALRTEISS